MKVKQLIKKLQKLNPNLDVFSTDFDKYGYTVDSVELGYVVGEHAWSEEEFVSHFYDEEIEKMTKEDKTLCAIIFVR